MRDAIFCTFARKDYADTAISRLMREAVGIRAVRRCARGKVAAKGYTSAISPLPSFAPESSAASLGARGDPSAGQEPVTVKIICDSASKNRVVSLLKSMNGALSISQGAVEL